MAKTIPTKASPFRNIEFDENSIHRIYRGVKSDLIASGLARKEMFPVAPKRNRDFFLTRSGRFLPDSEATWEKRREFGRHSDNPEKPLYCVCKKIKGKDRYELGINNRIDGPALGRRASNVIPFPGARRAPVSDGTQGPEEIPVEFSIFARPNHEGGVSYRIFRAGEISDYDVGAALWAVATNLLKGGNHG